MKQIFSFPTFLTPDKNHSNYLTIGKRRQKIHGQNYRPKIYTIFEKPLNFNFHKSLMGQITRLSYSSKRIANKSCVRSIMIKRKWWIKK